MIRIEVEGPIARLILDRPKVNAMSHAFLRAMEEAFARVAAAPEITGVLVTSAHRCFSAGLDLRELVSLDKNQVREFLADFDRAFLAAFRCPKPVAMAVEGHAIAGGMVLALCADFLALGRGDYKLGLTELRVGVPFPDSALRIVEAALGPRALRHYIYTAGLLGAAESYDLGVGDALADDPVAAAREWLALCTTERPMETFRIVKAKLRAHANARIDETGAQDRERMVAALTSDEVRAALAGALRP